MDGGYKAQNNICVAKVRQQFKIILNQNTKICELWVFHCNCPKHVVDWISVTVKCRRKRLVGPRLSNTWFFLEYLQLLHNGKL